jgi:hypothetical protein
MDKKRTLSDLSRQELYDLVWSTPRTKLATEFGISDVAISKRCKKLNVPRPSLGYWAKIAAGQTLPKTPLPPTSEELFAKQARTPLSKSLPLPGRADPPHTLAAGLVTALNKADLDSNKRARVYREREYPEVCVSKALVDRAAKAFHVILAALEPLGINWHKSQSSRHPGHFRKGHDRVQLTIVEDVIRADGTRESPPFYEHPQKQSTLSGLLTISITSGEHYNQKTIQTWSETKKLPLEELLAQLVARVRKHFLDAQELRQKQAIEYEKQRVEAERRWEEEKKREAIRLQQEKEQNHAKAISAAKHTRRANLIKAAQDWRFCGSLLEFVEQCERHWKSQPQPLTPEQIEWLEWARQTASSASTFPADFPDPAQDGGFDPGTIPFGGPYPKSRNRDD